MNTTYEQLKNIEIDDLLALIFVATSIVNIIGDNEKRKYVNTNDETYNHNANKLFIIVQLITVIASVYFIYRNYKNNNKNNTLKNKIRLVGSVLIFVGAILILLTQFDDEDVLDFPE